MLAAVVLLFGQSEEQGTLLKTFRSEFVEIKPGTPAIRHPFQMAKYEVPQNLWESVMGSNPSKWKGKRNSVEMLSFTEAEEFCRKATELMRAAKLIDAEQVVRLPSEAEWEYAARAGTTTAYSFGDDVKDLDAHAWHTGNAAGNDPPVGAKKPNPWGLHDVHGYLWEWCSDAWEGDAKKRVLRGGSWKDKAEKLTSSYRRAAPVELKDDAVGLRCVLASPEKK
jgi:formylglycine-generating enzyme required for sulfatase activity